MRNLDALNAWRRADLELGHYGAVGNDVCGLFEIPSTIDRKPLRVIATAIDGWDHVSVSRKARTPNWPEMEQVKRLFFEDDETAMQLHVPAAEHVNNHPHYLHLWRPHAVDIPKPPGIFVGVAGLTPDDVRGRLAAAKAAGIPMCMLAEAIAAEGAAS